MALIAAVTAVAAVGLTACSGSDGEDADAVIGELLPRVTADPLSEDVVRLVEAMGRRGRAADAAYLVDVVRIGFSSAATERALEALPRLTGIPATGRLQEDYLAAGAFVMTSGLDPGPDYPAFKAALYAEVDPRFVPLLQAVPDRSVLAALQWGGVQVGGIVELRDPVRVRPEEVTWPVPEEEVFGVIVNDEPVAYPERILARHELVDDHVGGVPVVVAYCTLCRAARAFDRRVDGTVLDFRTSGLLLASNKVMLDDQTRSLWQQLTGEAIGGPLTGRQLAPYPVTTTTMAEWRAEQPGTALIDLPAPFIPDPETGTLTTYSYQPDAAYAGYNASEQLWYPTLGAPDDLAPKALVATVDVGGEHLAVGLEALRAGGPVTLSVGGRLLRFAPTPRGATVTALDGGDDPEVGQSSWFAWYGIHPDTGWWPRTDPQERSG